MHMNNRNFIRYLLLVICPFLYLNYTFAQTQGKTALYLEEIGMVDIQKKDPSICVHMMYAFKDNFVGSILYEDLKIAYLHPMAAESLLKAHQYLKEIHPNYCFIIYDACRPMSVQQKMWDKVKGTSKARYVSNPANGGGLHNYGMAVDISILDDKGNPLPMGTAVDHLGPEAHIDKEKELIEKGVLTASERKNRELLRTVMKKAGFRALPSEWWHFNRISRLEAKKNYKPIP